MKTRWVDSVPAWAMGPRAANSKFGGNIILGGIPVVADRLRVIAAISDILHLSGEESLRSSGHSLLEVKTGITAYSEFNAEGAIDYAELKAGIRAGIFPRWVAMTAPQFGFRGAERGGIISPRDADRAMARALHVEAIERSLELKQAGLGAGITIWWPAFCARIIGFPGDKPSMDFQDARDTMLDFWVAVLKETGGTVWLEWKPGDPGIDYLMTSGRAADFCGEVNSVLGRKAMFINDEWAHILLSGITIVEGTQKTIDAGLFNMFVHGNYGQMLPVSIQELLNAGTSPENIPIGIDWDWPVGSGDSDGYADQQEAIGLIDRLGQEVVYFEHDVNPSGREPIDVFTGSILARRKMLASVRNETAT